MRFLLSAVAALCALSSLSSVEALSASGRRLLWGKQGHAAVAAVAQVLVNSKATAELKKYLPESDGKLEPIASWADEMRDNPAYAWSEPLHFIDTPAWKCDYERARDCKSDVYGANFCVDTAIQNYTARAMDKSLESDQKNEAMKFLVHFLGDIHQPLHCGFAKDYGGNSIKGYYMGESDNLHYIWDSAMIYTRIDNDFDREQAEWINHLITTAKKFPKNVIQTWTACEKPSAAPYGACTEEWGNEAVKLACSNAYVAADGTTRLTDGFDLEDDYYERNLPVIEKQILKGAVRLANILNHMFPEDGEAIKYALE